MTTGEKILLGAIAAVGLFTILFNKGSYKEDIRSRLEKKSIEELERDMNFLAEQDKFEAAAVVRDIINQKKQNEKHLQRAGEEAVLSDAHDTGRGNNAAVQQTKE